jgi:hypothetical protein
MKDPTAPGWGGHVWRNCTAPDCPGCMLCDGGLALCAVCGGLEGALTSTCVGRKLTADEIDRVYKIYCENRHGTCETPTLEECGL